MHHQKPEQLDLAAVADILQVRSNVVQFDNCMASELLNFVVICPQIALATADHFPQQQLQQRQQPPLRHTIIGMIVDQPGVQSVLPRSYFNPAASFLESVHYTDDSPVGGDAMGQASSENAGFIAVLPCSQPVGQPNARRFQGWQRIR